MKALALFGYGAAAYLSLLACLLWAPSAAAQSQRLAVGVGIGSTLPLDEAASDLGGNGFGGVAEVEYIYESVEWLTPRAYAGAAFMAPRDCEAGVSPCDVSTKIGFLGAKARLLAPFPYVAPFIELGLGGSLGSLSTRVGDTVDHHTNGVTYHVPVTIGLALGERRQFEIALSYLLHPAEEQYTGAFGLRFEFPLGAE
jgi:hypothetical protein